ncbi:MAG: phosphate ABC transporter substrate-binding protein PstS [Acetobacteraceae bacterium]|nr:phosphate ABC transporter substrate-binding protein PstS [Acetobacteraceae bacterium]
MRPRKPRPPRLGAAAAVLLALAVSCLPLPIRAGEQVITETGSTLMLPLLQEWAAAYAKVAPNLRLAPSGSDSGTGIASVIKGTVLLGASDAYMSDPEVAKNPGILNIPLAISAQTINYNLPGLARRLRLSGPVLAGIYRGRTTDWSDPAIAALNPGLALPHHTIVPIRRADASGDTFIFTQFLTFSDQGWENGPGYGTTIAWPAVLGAQTATGNDGMVKRLAETPYGVAYIGGSYAAAIAQARLGTAELLNAAGRFVLPTEATVTAAAAELTPRTPADERLTLAFAPGADAYPLINYEYAIVRRAQSSAEDAAALRDFLVWAITPGQGSDAAFLNPVHFIPLPVSIRALSLSQIAQIH